MLAPNSFGHPMLSLVIINLLAGALLGVRFTVVIVIPAAFAALVEAILLEFGAGSWNSLVWHTVILIVAIEVGFILGVALCMVGASSDDPPKG